MNQEKAREIFIEYLTKPDFDRVYFLIEKEEESKRPPEVFARYILEAFQFYNDTLYNGFQQFKSWGNAPLDYPILLKNESGGQIIFIHLYLSQMSYHYEGINEYINKRCSKKKEPERSKRNLSDMQLKALVLFYTDKVLVKADLLWKALNKWSKADYRTHCNGNAKSYNTKLAYLQEAKTRLLSMKTKEAKRGANKCQKDIEQLIINWGKKVPG